MNPKGTPITKSESDGDARRLAKGGKIADFGLT